MAAAEGNKYAIGNTGKPKKYETDKELLQAVTEYFESILGETNEYIESPTVTGLALHIGFASRQSIYDYIKDKEFSYILKRAITVIENHHEKRMDGDKVVGSIFVLKNMGWSDNLDLTTKGDKIADKIYQVREVIVDKTDEA